jgi:P27 family predicted phage terminase small subunit
LSPAGLAHWKTTLDLLSEHVDLVPIDGDCVALYCESLARYCVLRDEAAASPLLHLTPSGERPHPIHRMVLEAASQASKLAGQLGMSPQTRKGLRVPTGTPSTPETLWGKNGKFMGGEGGFAT